MQATLWPWVSSCRSLDGFQPLARSSDRSCGCSKTHGWVWPSRWCSNPLQTARIVPVAPPPPFTGITWPWAWPMRLTWPSQLGANSERRFGSNPSSHYRETQKSGTPLVNAVVGSVMCITVSCLVSLVIYVTFCVSRAFCRTLPDFVGLYVSRRACLLSRLSCHTIPVTRGVSRAVS